MEIGGDWRPTSEIGQRAPQALRLAVIGASVQPIDGVRDHALKLARGLQAEGVSCSVHWLSLEGPKPTRRASTVAWTRALPGELRDSGAQALLFHYSAYSYYFRGLPLLVHPVVTAMRRSEVALITIMHEFVYPWRLGGAKGKVWASADRIALRELLGACAAVLATTESRRRWLCGRWWLPTRPTSFAPAFSNLPQPTAAPATDRAEPVVGLFGYYALDAATIALVLDAVAMLLQRGVALRLLLLGSPERSPAAGESWLREAGARGLIDRLSFSGTLAAQELSDALASCDVLLYANAVGPISSKGTLAGSLASGRPVVALEGRDRWQPLEDAGAARVVPRADGALADALTELLRDARAREALGARGRAFAEGPMGLARTTEAVIGLLAHTTRGGGRDQRARSGDHEDRADR